MASFRREKFLPFGGPDGGDGGKGGDIYLEADAGMDDLASFKHRSMFRGGSGGMGGKNRKHGLNAAGLVIKVPVGTSAYVNEGDAEEMLADLPEPGRKVLVALGGRGGKGNVHYATSTRKAPEIFQPGEEGQQRDIMLRMRQANDVCLLGMPNSGKSSLLAAVSAARPEVADYPFTTRLPVRGSADDGEKRFIWAELPGLVEGSSMGKGLGNRFLCHAERANLLLYVLDAGSGDAAADLDMLIKEVGLYGPTLEGKPAAVVLNKADLSDSAALEALSVVLANTGMPLFTASALSGEGIPELVKAAHGMVLEKRALMHGEGDTRVIFRPKPKDRGG